MTDLAAIRRRYAARMLALANVADSAVEAAFTRVPREAFAGPAPWTLIGDREKAGDAMDPAALYADVLVALDTARGLNNGSPSLHALLLHRLGVRPGDHILHAGIGTGYYTALLAELAGPDGHVTAIEVDETLANAARENLRPWPNVTVLHSDAAAPPPGPFDRIYVNFAVAQPAPAWLDVMRDRATLVLPLGTARPGSTARHAHAGAALRITRIGTGYAVRFLCRAYFVLAEGPLAGDAASRGRLFAAFERDGVEFVQSLIRSTPRHPPPPERAWYWTPYWSLSFDPLDLAGG